MRKSGWATAVSAAAVWAGVLLATEVRDRTLRNALDALLAGRPVANPRVPSLGCYLGPIPGAAGR